MSWRLTSLPFSLVSLVAASRSDSSLARQTQLIARFSSPSSSGCALCPKDIYTPTLGLSPLIDGLFAKLRRKVDEELTFQKELMGVQGALDMVFASSQRPTAGAGERK